MIPAGVTECPGVAECPKSRNAQVTECPRSRNAPDHGMPRCHGMPGSGNAPGARNGPDHGMARVRRSLIEVPVFVGRVPHPLLEKPAEMLWVFETERVRYFADGLGGVEDPLFRNIDDFLLYILLG